MLYFSMMKTDNPFVDKIRRFDTDDFTKNLNWLYEIQDVDLHKDFQAYCYFSRSKILILVVALYFTFIALPSEIAMTIYTTTHTFKDAYDIYSGFYVANIFLIAVSSWFYILQKFYPKLHVYDKYSSTIFLITLTAYFLLRMNRSAIFPCNFPWVYEYILDRSCNSAHHILAWDTGANLLAPPIFYVILLKESRLWLVLLSFFLILIATASLAIIYNPWGFPVLIIWAILGLIFIFEVHIQLLRTYFLKRRVLETLVDKEDNQAEIQINEMRSMIANVAHDLKTPLSSFSSGIDIIEDTISDCRDFFAQSTDVVPVQIVQEKVQNIQQFLEDIRTTNNFMLMTINRCLDFTKARKGMKLVPRNETISLYDTLKLPLNCMRNIQNRIQIIMKPIPTNICSHIITDKQWLQENILCLLSNAVKYSSSGDVTVTVSMQTNRAALTDMYAYSPLRLKLVPHSNKVHPLHPEDSTLNLDDHSQISGITGITLHHLSSVSNARLDTSTPPLDPEELSENIFSVLRFEIEDHGIGMTEEAMASLFNPFKQTQRLAGGTGLGLYSLAKRIEALKGHYGIMKRRDGKQGSLFWFTIPYKPDEVMATLNAKKNELDAPIEPLSMYKAPHTLDTSSKTDVIETKATRPSVILDDKHLSILLVEDSPTILKMTTMMLRKQGHLVFNAENGAIAVKMLEDHWKETGSTYDVVLMDLQMPVMDGLEATKRIRTNEAEHSRLSVKSNHKSRPRQLIIGCSANSDNDTSEEALKIGFDGFMAKPFTVDSFHLIANQFVPKFKNSLLHP